MKAIASLFTGILLTLNTSASTGPEVDPKNPIQVACMQETPWKVYIGQYAQYSDGKLMVIQVNNGQSTTIDVDSDSCRIGANFIVETTIN